MRPDMSREIKQSWIVLAGAVVLALIACWFAWNDGGLADQVADEGKQIPVGGIRLSEQVKRSQEANQNLSETISELKTQVGFTLEKAFEVKDDLKFTRQPGYYFLSKRDSICERLKKRAQEKGITVFGEFAGFSSAIHQPPDDKPPKDETPLERANVYDLLRTLQITDKLVSTCLETPSPLQELVVLPHGTVNPGLLTPPGRPPLCKEYAVTIKIRGSLTDILWILHRLSPGRDAPGEDYPLILKSMTIDSFNFSPVDSIPQIDLLLKVAGMHFLSDAERDAYGKPAGTRRVESSTTSVNPVSAGTARSF